MATLKIEHVSAIMPNAVENGLDKEWNTFVETLRTFEINTKNRIAAFLMNVAKESGELYYVEELADGWDYEWRADLGNTQRGDGPFFKGHGYIQITGRLNHGKVAKALDIDCVAHPEILTKLPYTWLSAGWYWRHGSAWGDLNEFADAGDYKKTILGVRGGPDTDREHYWWTALEELPDEITLPKKKADPDPEPVEWPTAQIAKTEQGWLYVVKTGEFLRGLPNTEAHSDEDGWWADSGVVIHPPPIEPEPEVKPWKWPEANDAPNPNSWNYAERNPTRYTFRADVEEIARSIVDKWGGYYGKLWCLTYHHHPETVWLQQGVSREVDSIDIWGNDGRGSWLDEGVGAEVFDYVWNLKGEPYIEWIIYHQRMYGAWNNWNGEYFGGDEFTNHDDHIHITYRKR